MVLKVSRTFDKTNAVYRSKKWRQIVNVGGSRSGKSYSILQLFCLLLLERINLKITVWRDLGTVCRGTVLKDFENILYSDPFLYSRFKQNKSQGSFRCNSTNSEIIFMGCDNVGKVLGMAQDISFFNEITEMNEEVYDQITQRTRETVFVDYNPSRRFWFDKYRKNPNTKVIHSTYRDNYKFLTEDQKYKLESYNPNVQENIDNDTANEYMYKVYCLGLLAEKPNRVYKGWGTCTLSFFNKLSYNSYYGVDFGTRSPSAIVEVKFDGDRTFYLRQRLYKPTSLMGMPFYKYIQTKLPDISSEDLLISDSAKMQMVYDLINGGFNAVPAIKGGGSVDSGISSVHGFNIVYCDDSLDLDDEYFSYSFEVDRYGLATDKIVKKNDHLMDAIRYCIDFLINYLDITV